MDEERQTAEIAPIYDCGSCLYPQLGIQEMRAVLNDESEINKRIYEYPTSAIMDGGAKSPIPALSLYSKMRTVIRRWSGSPRVREQQPDEPVLHM